MKRLGMHGETGESNVQKTFLTVNHFAALVAVWWLLFAGGIETVASWTGTDWSAGDALRRGLLFVGLLIYFIRVLFTSFYLLRRAMGWEEAITVSLWLYFLNVGFALMGGTQEEGADLAAGLGILMYVFGSVLNTASETMRHLWKQRPANKGKLYTEGLFGWSIHVNYFGDVILSIGLVLVSGNRWAMLLPVVMAAGFLFMHIPMLDRHLAEKYGDDFREYSSNTAKLIPFVY
jgi:protein-S-isoprenylcysteine O-methyltransferase Ste14